MDIIKFEIGGKTFKIFQLEIKGKITRVAEEAFNTLVEDCIEKDKYHKVQQFDNYDYYIAQSVADDENESEIRAEVEGIIEDCNR